MKETWVRSLGCGGPLKKEMVTHPSILAWRIPWIEEPGGLRAYGYGVTRVRHSWATNPAPLIESKEVLVDRLHLTLCDHTNCSPPGSSIHGILQERILEWFSITYLISDNTTVLQSSRHWHKNRIIDQWNKMENPETNPHTYGHIIFVYYCLHCQR